jgi:superfamily II DNA or RNA helicase
MTRTERQQEAIKKWIKSKGKGTIEASTGFGKTRLALTAIKKVLEKYPNLRILVVVPTTTLKEQWESQLTDWDIVFNAEVQIINTVIKHNWTCDFLVLDEIHRYSAETFSNVFSNVKYKLVMGLTATFERLDGKHTIIQKYCPIVDKITKEESIINGWMAKYKEYQVLLNVDDIEVYKKLNKEFVKYFEFFGYDFKKCIDCLGPEGWRNKLKLRDEMYQGDDEAKKKEILQAITVNAMGLQRTMAKRKAFINNHPKKIEIAQKIMNARPNAKIITFSKSVKMAEALENGQNVYTGKVSKKKGRVMIEDFNDVDVGRLHTCDKANEGLDVKGLSVAIILGFDSSETKARQRRGRTVRKEGDKQAEIFYLVINDTQETAWFKNSHKSDSDYLTIDEQGLEQVLKGETPELYKKKLNQLTFRF